MSRTAVNMAACLLLISSCLVTIAASSKDTDYPRLYNQHLLDTTNSSLGNESHGHGHGGVHLVSWNFDYVADPLAVSIVILFAGLIKLAFHYASFLSSIVPESCVLIAVGTVMGVIVYYGFNLTYIQLTPRTFLLFLLPPIVLESAYSLNDRVFMQNLGSILVYAVIGTIISFLVVGPALYGLAVSGAMGPIEISIVQCLLFASFIVAVDPVAVLAIFQEVGVNSVLYFLVFGESLLNDAVTVVISSMMKAFNDMDDIPLSQIGLGVGSFFTISLGGLVIGIVFGVLSALVTRTTQHVRVVEPLALLVLAYLSYIVAELFHWSGIISMIGCGLIQAQYAFHNISHKSLITVEYFIKMFASIMDAVIFLFLGIELITSQHVWHTGFILWSLLLCLVVRLLTVFGLTFIVNRVKRVHPIKPEEQFIMWYGGLRGAVCFALADTINPAFPHKNLFTTCTFVIIMFTVFIQGITIKPLVTLCHIARKGEDNTMLIEELQDQMNDHIMSGIELIIDQQGQNYFRSWLSRMNDKYLRGWLQNDPLTQEQRILEVYREVAVLDFKQAVETGAPYLQQPISQTPGEVASRLSAMPEFSHMEYDRSILRRRRPSTLSQRRYASPQRQSLVERITGRSKSSQVNSVTDFRRLLKGSGSGQNTLHRRYDPDLVKDNERDFAAQLQERLQRLSRFHAYQRNSYLITSAMGSQQNIPQFTGQNAFRTAAEVHRRPSSEASSTSTVSDYTRTRVSYNPNASLNASIELQPLGRTSSRQNGSNV